MNNNRHNQLKNSKTSLKTLILKLIIIINNYKIKINKKYNQMIRIKIRFNNNNKLSNKNQFKINKILFYK